MKFSFVELSCRIQLDGTKLREIFLHILVVFVSQIICRRNKYSYNQIENFRQFHENKISGNNQHTRGIVSENRKYELDKGECIFKNN
jgi:hypothetical protein